MAAKKEIDTIAAFVHGALFGLHMLGLVYNLKRRNYLYSAIHAAVAVFDAVSTAKHLDTDEDKS
ncbi:MAG: hypothetical protein H8E12_16795 [Rhodobacteraceae bacterium]|nr:hypothetical protein [Paracoccaceae bacterium]